MSEKTILVFETTVKEHKVRKKGREYIYGTIWIPSKVYSAIRELIKGKKVIIEIKLKE